jgi:hypothetical protein
MSNKFEFDRNMMMSVIGKYISDVQVAVEVGTYKGDFAVSMIDQLNPAMFYAVDPLRLFPGMNSRPGYEFVRQSLLDRLADQVKHKMSVRGHALIRETSEKASQQFEDNSIDVVYLDADHSYTGCSNDIDFWFPKVREGGILAGHDYCNGNVAKGHVYGVIQAVAQLVDEHDFELFVTSERDYPSWMIVKGNNNIESLKAQAS